jgi:hypothetical protein
MLRCTVVGSPGASSGSATRWLLAAALAVLVLCSSQAGAQQFNSDNWWVLPYATGVGVITGGEHYSTMYLGYGFLDGWEFDIGVFLYQEDEKNTTSHYSTTVYLKRLIVQNDALTKGAAVMAGIGQGPGYLESGELLGEFKNYWVSVPMTFPFFDNTLSWDLMPGGTWNIDYGPEEEHAAAFTWSSRLAIYRIVPQSALVLEVFGAEGNAEAAAQYKAGVRWESKYVIAALTYGDGLEGNEGGGLEIGFMFLTPPYK